MVILTGISIFTHPPSQNTYFIQYIFAQSRQHLPFATASLWQDSNSDSKNCCLKTALCRLCGSKINVGFLFTLPHSNFHSQPCPKHFLSFITGLQGGSAVTNPSERNTNNFSTIAGRTPYALSDKQVDQKTKRVTAFPFSQRCFSLNCTLCTNWTFSYQRKPSVTEAFALHPQQDWENTFWKLLYKTPFMNLLWGIPQEYKSVFWLRRSFKIWNCDVEV